MKVDEAQALASKLTEQLNEAGHDVTIKVFHPWNSKLKTDYTVKLKKMVVRKNLLSGLPFEEDEDTPGFMSPASEAYHSM